MTDSAPAAAPVRSRWWSLLLIASLALNLLVGGMIAARFFWAERMGRFYGPSYTQLLPRKFIEDLDRDRRKEVLAILKSHRDRYNQGRESLSAAALQVSTALKSQPYDEVAVKTAVESFSKAGNEMVANGSSAVLDLIAKLTPEERAGLASRIEERARRRK